MKAMLQGQSTHFAWDQQLLIHKTVDWISKCSLMKDGLALRVCFGASKTYVQVKYHDECLELSESM